MGSQKAAIKSAVAQILSCAMQPDADIQRLIEERKKALELTEDYPFVLLEIVQNEQDEEAEEERLMAATFLKNYIQDYYSHRLVGFDTEVRHRLALNLIELMPLTNQPIREMISSALQFLIYREFPLRIDSVTNKLIEYLLHENVEEIDSATSFMRSLDDNFDEFAISNFYFSAHFLEPLMRVLYNERLSTVLRSRIAYCSVQLLISSSLMMNIFTPINLRVTAAFHKFLSDPYSPTCDFKLKGEIVMELAHAVKRCNIEVTEMVTECLPVIGQIMFSCSAEVKAVLMGQREVPRDEYEVVARNFNQLIWNIITLINELYLVPSFYIMLHSGMKDFIYFLFLLMCPYDTTLEYVFDEEEIDNTPETDYTIRGRCGHTLMVFMDRSDNEFFIQTVHQVIQKHISEAENMRSTNEMYSYHIIEACLFGIGLLHHVSEHPAQYFTPYLEILTTRVLTRQNHWLVLSRLLWLGGQYSEQLNPTMLNNHLTAVLANVNSHSPALRIAAIHALRNHLRAVRESHHQPMVFAALTNQICDAFFTINIESRMRAILCFQAMGNFFTYSPESATVNVAQIVCYTIINALRRHLSDAGVIKEVNLVLTTLIRKNPVCSELIKNELLPFIVGLIQQDGHSVTSQQLDAPERGFELLNTIIKYYPETPGDDLMIQAFVEACGSILAFSDNSVMEIGTILISNILMKAAHKIKESRDVKGKELALYIPEVLFQLLEPYPQETVCPSKFGRLCVISIMTLPEVIEPRMEAILKALLSAMQRATTSSTIQSFCFIFAYMFSWQTANTVKFLSRIPGPDGRSALSYFLNKWQFDIVNCEKFEINIMTLAICKSIEYSLTEEDERINDCTVVLRDDPYSGEVSGLERLYLWLVQIMLHEERHMRTPRHESEFDDDTLIRNHPIWNLNVGQHIRTFLRNYRSDYFFNILRTYIRTVQEDFSVLENYDLVPDNL